MPRYARHTTSPLRWKPSGWLAQNSGKEAKTGSKEKKGGFTGKTKPQHVPSSGYPLFPSHPLALLCFVQSASNRRAVKILRRRIGVTNAKQWDHKQQLEFRALEHQVFPSCLSCSGDAHVFCREKRRKHETVKQTIGEFELCACPAVV